MAFYLQQQQPVGFWGGLLSGLAGGIMKNAEEKQRIAQNQKIVDTESKLWESLGTQENPSATQPSQGLLGAGGLARSFPNPADYKTGLFGNNQQFTFAPETPQPNTKFNIETPLVDNRLSIQKPLAEGLTLQQAKDNPNFNAMPTTIPTTTTAPSTLTTPNRNTLLASYRKQRAQTIKELVGYGLDAKDAINRVDSVINQRVDLDYGKAVDDFMNPLHQELETAITTSNNDPSAKKKAIMMAAKLHYYGQRFGRPVLDFNMIRQGIDADDLTIDKEDDGSQFRYVVRRKDGRPFGMAKNEKGEEYPVYVQAAGDWVSKQMSPAEKDASARGWKALAKSDSRYTGGSATASRYVDTPLGKMTPAQILQAYKQAKGGRTVVDDGFGGQRVTTMEGNPDIERLLRPYVTGVREQYGLPQEVDKTGVPAIDAKIEQARSLGVPEDEIAASVSEMFAPKNQVKRIGEAPYSADFDFNNFEQK